MKPLIFTVIFVISLIAGQARPDQPDIHPAHRDSAVHYGQLGKAELTLATRINIRDNYLKALQYYEKSLEFSPEMLSSYMEAGNIALQLEKYDKAIIFYLGLLQQNEERKLHLDLNPNSPFPELRAKLAYCYEMNGQSEQAYQAIRKAAIYFPDNEYIKLLFKQIAGTYELAINLDSTSSDSEILVKLGHLSIDTGDFSKAADQANQLLTMNKNSPEAFRLLGCAALQESNFSSQKNLVRAEQLNKEAIGFLQNAFDLGANGPVDYFNLGSALSNQNLLFRNHKLLNEGIEKYPDHDGLHHLLGLNYQKLASLRNRADFEGKYSLTFQGLQLPTSASKLEKIGNSHLELAQEIFPENPLYQ